MLDPTLQLTNVSETVAREDVRAHSFLRGLLRTYENQYHHFMDGTFDEAVWAGYRNSAAQTFASPRTREFWTANRHLYSADFADFVDSNLVS